jgi:hypothetical protein
MYIQRDFEELTDAECVLSCLKGFRISRLSSNIFKYFSEQFFSFLGKLILSVIALDLTLTFVCNCRLRKTRCT